VQTVRDRVGGSVVSGAATLDACGSWPLVEGVLVYRAEAPSLLCGAECGTGAPAPLARAAAPRGRRPP
jgi:hypothetical protein